MASEKEQGYVYILTNDSFREDWVKIGMSSRPVNVRSKELDNTAVPLPFKIYATLRTVKYNIVEKQLHAMLDKLTDTRIRPNREFFNVKPETALDTFKILAATIDDAVIEVYDESGEVKEVISLGNTDEKVHYFYIHGDKRFYKAKGYYDEKKQVFVLLAGSILALNPVSSMLPGSIKKRQEFIADNCIEEANGYRLTKDVVFNSPSQAAIITEGRNTNGWVDWKDEDKKTLDETYRKK